MANNMNHYAVMDVETGGKDQEQNPITEIALSILEPKNLTIVASYQSYVKQYNDLKIEQSALDATQITMKMVESGKDIKKVISEISEILIKHSSKTKRYRPVVVGHNIEFDFLFIDYAYALLGKNFRDYVDFTHIDTMFEQRKVEFGTKGADSYLYNLGACCERMGIKLHSAHGAEADVDATSQLLIKQINISRNGRMDDANTIKDNRTTKKSKTRTFFEM